MNGPRHALLPVAAMLLAACPAASGDPQRLPWVPGSATVVMVPDFDEYYPRHTDLMEAQTRWIADNSARRNIAYAIQLGDLTNHNSASEWEIARRAFATLDGKVPYAVVPGNHDYDESSYQDGIGRRSTRINEFFEYEEFRKSPHFGGAYQDTRMENTYHRLTIHDRNWLILCLEFGPRDEVVAWANRVLDEHKDRLVMVNTHAYLFYNNARYDRTRGPQRASPAGWGNEGQELWSKLIRRHANVMIVMCGHLASAYNGYRVDEGAYGNHVHQMLCDYEKLRGGGMGYMRLLEFLPDGKTVQVRTFSPALQQTRSSELEEFQFTLKLADRATPTAETAARD